MRVIPILFCLSLLVSSTCLAQQEELELPPISEEVLSPAPEAKEKAPSAPIPPAAPTPPAPAEEEKQIKQITLVELTEMLAYRYKGKVVVLSFFSPYCKKCTEVLPTLEEIYQKHPQDIMVIGISLVGYPKKVWLSVNRMRINYPVFMGDADVLDAYDIHTLPSIILIGKDGREEEAEKDHEVNKARLEKEIVRLLEGRPKTLWRLFPF